MNELTFSQFKEQYRNLTDSGERKKFIDQRLITLLENETSQKIGMEQCGSYSEFIGPKNEIVSNTSGLFPNLSFDDFDCYQEFLDFIDHDVDGYLYNEPSGIICVQKFIWNYFGLNGGDVFDRMDFYTSADNVASIKDLKGKSIAACSERSAMAQNLLKFMGYDSEIVFGKLNERTSHAYIVLHSQSQPAKYVLYDPMNPVVYEKDGETKYGIGACVMDESAYDSLMQGEAFNFNYDFAKKNYGNDAIYHEDSRVYTSDAYLYDKDKSK